jgi:hypothetical protein
MIKNEHIVWGIGELDEGKGQVLMIGVTDTGLEYLRAGVGKEKKTLLLNPPPPGFSNVTQVIVFHEKDKATVKQRFAEAFDIVSERN